MFPETLVTLHTVLSEVYLRYFKKEEYVLFTAWTKTKISESTIITTEDQIEEVKKEEITQEEAEAKMSSVQNKKDGEEKKVPESVANKTEVDKSNDKVEVNEAERSNDDEPSKKSESADQDVAQIFPQRVSLSFLVLFEMPTSR